MLLLCISIAATSYTAGVKCSINRTNAVLLLMPENAATCHLARLLLLLLLPPFALG
jgi:hypothetical protein